MLFLAKKEQQETVGLKKISEELSIPSPFLAKILQSLAKQKLLGSIKGPNGGFSILFDPRKTTLLDIVTAIDGPDVFTQCAIHAATCKCMDEKKAPCPIHNEYSLIRTELHQLFRSKTIWDLARQAGKMPEIMI